MMLNSQRLVPVYQAHTGRRLNKKVFVIDAPYSFHIVRDFTLITNMYSADGTAKEVPPSGLTYAPRCFEPRLVAGFNMGIVVVFFCLLCTRKHFLKPRHR